MRREQMRKKEQNEVWIMWMVKALLAAYVVTGILLIILALALYLSLIHI